MEERFTVKIDPTDAAKLSDLAAVLSETFFLSQEEAEDLLQADTLVLKRADALTLARLCRRTGVSMSMSAPLLTPAVRVKRWLKRYTMPVVFSLSSVLALALLFFFLPSNAPDGPKTRDSTVTREQASSGLPVSSAQLEPASEGVDIVILQPDADQGSPESLPIVPVSGAADLTGEQTPVDATSSQGTAQTLSAAATEAETAEAAVQAESSATPDLFTAARDLRPEAFEAILLASPTVDLRDSYGQTPLMYAAGHNSAEVVRFLLDAGSDPNARTEAGWTALMYAARNAESQGVSRVLLAAGGDPGARNDSGQSAHDIALAYNNEDALSSLASRRTTAAAPQPAAPGPGQEAAPVSPQRPVTVTSPASPAPVRTIQVVPVPTPITVRSQPDPVLVEPARADPAPELVSGTPPPSANEDTQNRSLILECLANWDACTTD